MHHAPMQHAACNMPCEPWFVTPCTCTMPCATCPMPFAPCPMHHAPCPVHHAPHTMSCTMCLVHHALCRVHHATLHHAPCPMLHCPCTMLLCMLPCCHASCALHHALCTMLLSCPMPHGLSTVQLRHSPHPFCLSRGEWGHSAQIMVYGHGPLVHGIWAW